MIKVHNTEAVVPESFASMLTPQLAQALLLDLADMAHSYWVGLAGRELFTTRRDYLRGLQKPAISPGMAVISLVGKLPHLVEEGLERPVDLRHVLLGPHVPEAPFGQKGKRKGKNGFYRSIPFRHATPGTGGAVGPPMGRAYRSMLGDENAASLGKRIYQVAKKLEGSRGQPYGRVEYGGRLDTEGLDVPKLKESHAVDIYQGMIREEKEYAASTQGKYITFRTITEDRKGKAEWVIPARAGKELMPRVQQHVDKMMPAVLETFMGEVLGR